MTQKLKFEIPLGYKGIREKINLESEANLIVITGINGCGKTTILKHIYENYPKREQIFFKTQSVQRKRRYNYISRRNKEDYDIPTFDNIMDSIFNEYERFTRDSLYSHNYEMFSLLFDESSSLYSKGYDFLEILSNILGEIADLDQIKAKLGIPTEKQKKDSLRSKINQLIKTSPDNKIFNYGTGKKVCEAFYSQMKGSVIAFEQEKFEKIRKINIEETEKLKKKLRAKSVIRNKRNLEDYIHKLVMDFSLSIESIVEKISKKIYEDAKAKGSKNRTKKLWEEINDELKVYNDNGKFRYQINQPSPYSSSYEINFSSIENENPIHFESLSSGEKVIFELICYYFVARDNNNLKLVILDEFDANLNPALAELYLNVIRDKFCNRNIKVILTTHSPSTVAEVKPSELYELLINENNKQKINYAKDEVGKKKILKKLAPKFVYYSEFGNLEYLIQDKSNIIVLLEGKGDRANFYDSNQYTFIDCGGSGTIKNFIICLKSITFFQNIIRDKLIICLYDYDEEGRKQIANILEKASENDIFCKKIQQKKDLFIKHKENIYLAMLRPPNQLDLYHEKPYRHQELKNEGKNGILRQINMIEAIQKEYDSK